MQSFAKAAAMPKKASTPKPATPSAPEDDIRDLALSDDGEDDSAAMPEPKIEPDQATETTSKRTKARQDLKRMMEESSEDEESEKEDTPMVEAEEPPAPEEAEEKKEVAEPAEVVSSMGDGRRRGKRQIMKKKTVMDDQGYLGNYVWSLLT